MDIHFKRAEITRKTAKEKLAHHHFSSLSEDEKLEGLASLYPPLEVSEAFDDYYDEDDLAGLDEEIVTLLRSKQYLNKPFKPVFKPLITELLITQYYGITNEYLSSLLKEKLRLHVNVKGEMEKMGCCPCCEFYSIGYGEDGAWDICTVCFWENGGDSPNHMKLEDARANFKRIGAMSPAALSFVDPMAKKKFLCKK